MARLLEVEYEDIFSPETMALLKGQSGKSLKQMLGDKNLMQVMRRSSELLPEIIEAEDGYRDALEAVAVSMVEDAYPIIDYANIKIEAEIVDMGNVEIPEPTEEEEETEIEITPEFGENNPELMKAKRRIINGITQGASIRGAFAFLLFREYLDVLSPDLVDKYQEILKLSFGIYDNEDAIAMLLAMIAQQGGPNATASASDAAGGSSEMVYDEEEDQFVIKARAICFPMLVHEIVKGLYEIVGTQGFGGDKEKNKAIIGQVDKLANEPRDLQYGKFVYDALNQLYIDANINDPRVRELLFAEIYKLEDDEFIPFIENAVNNKLTPNQKKWAQDAIRDIQDDLRKDDTGLPGLDYEEDDDNMGVY